MLLCNAEYCRQWSYFDMPCWQVDAVMPLHAARYCDVHSSMFQVNFWYSFCVRWLTQRFRRWGTSTWKRCLFLCCVCDFVCLYFLGESRLFMPCLSVCLSVCGIAQTVVNEFLGISPAHMPCNTQPLMTFRRWSRVHHEKRTQLYSPVSDF